ncbi:DNA-3-methyladenine glycosylase I [Macrococcus hajekii]|uniref:DNA-3-methyladenine glycosylase I n=1 Tax=Macrococcus hajekii TaxID=198482 RepID=A0A4R6BJ26_9STAP|nr:DNA-3-methyladenine glycosylase I [Macrococcus hajekii]TDM01689.1 DNA-3-methyladenine glycosylase I [Macrococcus hajekii]GGB06605.1 DNA-3-methyladenine glycosylase I [Macrococcus hajekii]
MVRPKWADSHPLMADYYDNEWGRRGDDQYLFEMLILEGFQAGLSWLTILKKRSIITAALHDFDVGQLAMYKEEDIVRLMQAPGMIKHRLKISSITTNAQTFQKVQEECGSFEQYLLSFTAGELVIHTYACEEDVPISTELSQMISRDMKKRGFKFVGPVIIYTYLSAVGIIQDIIEEDDKDAVSTTTR